MKSHTTLQQLFLSENNVGGEGAKAFAGALKSHLKLQYLYLSNKNKIGLWVTKAIADALKSHSTFQRLASSTSPNRIDRTKIQKVPGNYETEPEELSSEYFEDALNDKVSLGAGAFGAVFWFKDDFLKRQFAVKTMRLGLDEDQRKFVKTTFRTELQMLQRFRHPNIVRMYGYHLSTKKDGTDYLLYEFAAQGSLESMLKTEDGRKVLTFPRRLGSLLGVAQGLHFLHTGIQLDPNRPSMEKNTALHGDIKSANIYITSTFGAKLIDCGLGKLLVKDSKVLESIARSAQLCSGGGGGPLGTPAYRDPGYEHKDYDYGRFCDVFSLGVVMAEVFTGTLSAIGGTTGSGGGTASDARTIYRKYVHVSKKQKKPLRELREDVDGLILDASETLLDQLSSMSLECMDEEPEDRPSAYDIMVRLQDMIMKVHCGDTWPRTDSGVTGGARLGECCCICQEPTTLGLSCSDHFICAEHLPSHQGIARGQDPLECIMEGCSKCYREDEIQKCVPAAMYKHYVLCQGLHANYVRTFAKMYAIDFSNHLDTNIDVALVGIRYFNNKSDRALVALAHLATGEQTPCPKLVWIVPQKRIVQDGRKEMKCLFNEAFFEETAVYFLCENTYSKGHEDPILMNFKRMWIKHLLPLVKLSLLTLKAAEAVTPDLPFPILGVGWSEQLQYLEDLVSEESMQFIQETQDTLQDMETWFREIVDKGESMLEGSRVARIKKLISSSYEMLSQKSLEEENLPKWKPNMTAQIGYDDNGNKCKIKWIKV